MQSRLITEVAFSLLGGAHGMHAPACIAGASNPLHVVANERLPGLQWAIPPSTTLADLFTLLFAANPFSAAWASPWRWSSDEFEDGLAHGGQCRSRRRPVDSFFPALLFLAGDTGGKRRRSSS